jgi:hypothetical protein
VPSLRLLTRVAARLPRAADLLRRHGRPPAVLYFGEAPGDDLLATAVLRQWVQVRGTQPWYLTRHPQIFAGNPDAGLVLDYSPELAGALRAFGVPRRRLTYHRYDPATDRSLAPRDVHIVNLMCAAAGLPPIAGEPAPILPLDPSEIVGAASPRIAVQSSALGAAMPIRTKEWSVERMQAVVDALRQDAEIVQLGTPRDPRLAGTVD